LTSKTHKGWERTHPVSDIEEALLAGEIEHQQEPHGIPEERSCKAAEPGKHTHTPKGNN